MDVEPLPLTEELHGDQQPVRAHDDGRRTQVEAGLRALRLEDRHAETLGDALRRGWSQLPAAPLRRIGSREQGGDLVPDSESLQHVRSERRRRGDRDPGHV